MATPLDFIHSLRIASPCPASWADMAGDDRARFCAQCEKHVYDFSKMTAVEGLALIRAKEGNVCGRLWRRADGTVITADCPVGVRRIRSRSKVKLPLAAAALLAMGLSNLGCLPRPKADQGANATAKAHQAQQDQKEVVVIVGLVAPVRDTHFFNGLTMSHEDWGHLPLR